MGLNVYQFVYWKPVVNTDPDGRGVWTKLGKVAYEICKTGDAASAFADTLQAVAMVVNPAATPLDRGLAALSLASELPPVSVGDLNDGYRRLKAAKLDTKLKQALRSADDVNLPGASHLDDAAKKFELNKGYRTSDGKFASPTGEGRAGQAAVDGVAAAIENKPG